MKQPTGAMRGKVELKLSLEKVQEDIAEFFKQRLKGILATAAFLMIRLMRFWPRDFQNCSDTLLRVRPWQIFVRTLPLTPVDRLHPCQ